MVSGVVTGSGDGPNPLAPFLKGRGKAVTCNDLLASSCLNDVALVENEGIRLSEADIERFRRWMDAEMPR